jgi:hypothetical protein
VINAYFKKELDQVQITNKKNSCVSLCEKRGGKNVVFKYFNNFFSVFFFFFFSACPTMERN